MSLIYDAYPISEKVYLKTADSLINGNVLVVGSTGSGKTKSLVEPRLLYAENTSLVVPIVKKSIYDIYRPHLEKRGYRVISLDISHPENSTLGIDFFKELKTEDDYVQLSGALFSQGSKSIFGELDSYWSDSASDAIAAMMILCGQTKNARFGDFLKLYNSLRVSYEKMPLSNLDGNFKELQKTHPGSIAPKLWSTLTSNAPKTSACIYSMMNSVIDNFLAKKELFYKKSYFDARSLGREKTALFIITKNTDKGSKRVCDLLYYNIFNALWELADENDGVLPVPVHIIADDFACGSTIPDFASHISVFRGMGVSCMLLLQSLSQLEALYGSYDAQTIRDNCDTFVYLGGLNLETCRFFSEYTDIPVTDIVKMRTGQEIVVRRGQEPIVDNRYGIFKDSLYEELVRD